MKKCDVPPHYLHFQNLRHQIVLAGLQHVQLSLTVRSRIITTVILSRQSWSYKRGKQHVFQCTVYSEIHKPLQYFII